ncbi:MAG: metal-dependent hydrolase [Candidatus Lokiarchaeota archaeon]|nr:metal-dependent hydrolase [Candidatus Lokiarchaeota archaeon]
MPDWIAHLMFGTILSFILGIKKEKRIIFLIGNIMPDFLRFPVFITEFLNLDLLSEFFSYPINESSHSIIGVLALASLISIFFEESLESLEYGEIKHNLNTNKNNYKFKLNKFQSFWQTKIKSPFFLLFIGGLFHIFLDSFMWPWAGGINWLYPFDFAIFRWSFKLWWPSSFDAIILLFPIFIISLIIKKVLNIYKVKNHSEL